MYYNLAMLQYLELLDDVLANGRRRGDRTGVGTLGVFGRQVRFDLAEDFPLLTTKKLHWKSVVHELLWFLRGDTNIQYLKDRGIRIWNEWADDDGELGPVYGAQWRQWMPSLGRNKKGQFKPEKRMAKGQKYIADWASNYYERVAKKEVEDKLFQPLDFDQVQKVIDSIKNTPDSRRHIVCAWDADKLRKMKLPPCHVLFQFYVADGALSCQLYQRSADIFLGVPFNIASYALLTCMTAHVCGLRPGEFVHTFGDLHLYLNHTEQAKTQLQRKPLPPPQLKLPPEIDNIFDFTYEGIELLNYEAHPHIPAPVAV